MASGKCRAILVQRGLAVSHGIFWEMRKTQEARLLWLTLLLEIPRIHCGRQLAGIEGRKSSGVLGVVRMMEDNGGGQRGERLTKSRK